MSYACNTSKIDSGDDNFLPYLPSYSDREELHKASSTERFEEIAMQRCVADATWLPHAFEAGSRIAASAKNGDNTSDRWL